MKNELQNIFKYLSDFIKHPEQYNDDMVALLKLEQVILLLNYINDLNTQLEYLRNNEYLKQVKWERDYNERVVEDYSSILQRIEKIINNEKITGIESKLMIKDLLEEGVK